MPIQIGAPDMAFPRLNALELLALPHGSITMLSGFFVSGGAANFGWVAYAPLSNSINTPGAGADLWIGGLLLTGFSAIFTGVNLTATIFYLRAPGMTMFRMPIFTWNLLVTAILILLAFPVLTAGLIMLYCDRHFGTHIFSVAGGGVPVLWQHIFWFWGHPEVYILALPFFGMVDRDHRRLLAQARLRLQGHGLRHAHHRRALARRVGAPHVHHRRRAAALLLDHEPSHRGARRASRCSTGSARCGEGRSGSRPPC